jgi:hypothetical protein
MFIAIEHNITFTGCSRFSTWWPTDMELLQFQTVLKLLTRSFDKPFFAFAR